jgi:hypothetical protein
MNAKATGNNPLMLAAVVGAVAFVLGLVIGLVVLGWWLWPVQWTDADPEHLSNDDKVEYVQLVADSFVLTGDIQKAKDRIARLGNGAEVIQLALEETTGIDNLRVSQLATVAGAGAPATGEQPGGGGATGSVSLVQRLLPFCAAGLLLVLVVGGGAFLYMRFVGGMPKSKGPARLRPDVPQGSMATRVETPAEIAAEAGPEPVTTFKTTYMLGNDLFDESFSIDDQQGDFLGECGVGIGEMIGVGDPKKVTAFEIWLFDKNDIRTVTKVLMSEHAFNDEGLKSRLAAKGEPVQAKSNGLVEMETATLKVTARLVDMQYGSGALPPNSFFQQLTLEISAWKKSEG